MSVFRVEKNNGYTVISNYHLRDKNLSLKTIGLLSLILSLPEDWDYSQAGLAAICKDGEDSIRSGLKELEKNGYLVRERIRDEKGKMTGILYHIYEVPLEAAKKLESNKKLKYKKPQVENPVMDNPIMDSPLFEKQPQINKELQNKELHNTDSIYPSILENNKNDRWMEEYETVKEIIKENVNYDFFKYKRSVIDEQFEKNEIDLVNYDDLTKKYDITKLDQVIGFICDTVTSRSKQSIKIGEDVIERKIVIEKLLKIDMRVIQEVIYVLNTNVIKNPKKYAISMLYNS